MKSTVKNQQMLARFVFVTLIALCMTFSSCDKGDDPKPSPPVVPVKLSLSFYSAPVLNSNKVITVDYLGTTTITATRNIASTITPSVAPDSISTTPTTTIFIYRKLAADKTISFTATAGSDQLNDAVTIKVTQPTADEKMIVGKFKELKAFVLNYDGSGGTTLDWRSSSIIEDIYTYGADKSLTIQSSNDFQTMTWSITMNNGVRYINRGAGTAVLEELTPTTMTIRWDATQVQFDAGLRSTRVTYIRIQ